MAKPLHCYNYDAQLKATLKHMAGYPQLLPFIGNAWEQQISRVLFVAESHYLPETSNGKSNSETWYNNDASFLNPTEIGWSHTRGVVTAADQYAVDKKHFAKGHSIFYNLKKAIFEAWKIKNTGQTLFQHFGYYNYFQRPAEITGKSIINAGLDNRIAYYTIKAIAESTKPTTIIFVSKKAYNSFGYWRRQEMDRVFADTVVYHVPHPASAWWNKKSKAYNNLTGRARFIEILKDMKYQLN